MNTTPHMNITAQFTADNLEPLFAAGIEHSFTFSNFTFTEYSNNEHADVSFDTHFPAHLTNDDLRNIFRKYGISELSDHLNDANDYDSDNS
jgi:hypothetical protein